MNINAWGGNRGGSPAVQQQGAPSLEPTDYQVTCELADTVSSLRWTPPGTQRILLAATSWDRHVRVFEVRGQGNQVAAQALIQQVGKAPQLDVSFSGDGARAFFGGCCCTANMWDLNTNQVQQVAVHDAPVKCVRFLPSHNVLVTGGWDKRVRVWDLRAERPVKEETLEGPIQDMDLTTGAFGTVLTPRKIYVFNVEGGMAPQSVVEPYKNTQFALTCISNLKNSMNGFVTGTVDGRIGIQFVPSGAQDASVKTNCTIVQKASGRQYDCHPLNRVDVHPQGNTVVTAAVDGTVGFWDLQTRTHNVNFRPKVANQMPLTVTAANFNGDGSIYAYAIGQSWHKGKEHFVQGYPTAIMLKPVDPGWLQKR